MSISHSAFLSASFFSQVTKIYVYLPYRGTIKFLLYIVPLALIIKYISAWWMRSNLLWALANMFFSIVKKSEISDSFIGKNTYVIRKVINTAYNTLLWLVWFLKFLISYECLKTYCQISAKKICANLGLFHILKQQSLKNCLKNQGKGWWYNLFFQINELESSRFYNKIGEKHVGRNAQETLCRLAFRIVILDIQRTIQKKNGFAPGE